MPEDPHLPQTGAENVGGAAAAPWECSCPRAIATEPFQVPAGTGLPGLLPCRAQLAEGMAGACQQETLLTFGSDREGESESALHLPWKQTLLFFMNPPVHVSHDHSPGSSPLPEPWALSRGSASARLGLRHPWSGSVWTAKGSASRRFYLQPSFLGAHRRLGRPAQALFPAEPGAAAMQPTLSLGRPDLLGSVSSTSARSL